MPDLAPDNSLGFHRFLLAETKNRLDHYQQAISQTVKAGDVVLDLGAGMGILSFLACQAGAGKVYAVEVTDVPEYAKLLAMANGLEERITFIQDLSFRVNLPEPVDLLVADIFGTFGLQAGGLAAVIDARERLLKSGAAIIPTALELFIVPVEVPEVYVKEVDIWATTLMGMDLSPIRRFAINNSYPILLQPEDFLGDPASFAQFQLATLASPRVGGEVSIRTLRDGVLHGLGGWFQSYAR